MPKKRPKSVFRRRNVQTPYTRISVRLVENMLPLVTGESVSFLKQITQFCTSFVLKGAKICREKVEIQHLIRQKVCAKGIFVRKQYNPTTARLNQTDILLLPR